MIRVIVQDERSVFVCFDRCGVGDTIFGCCNQGGVLGLYDVGKAGCPAGRQNDTLVLWER